MVVSVFFARKFLVAFREKKKIVFQLFWNRAKKLEISAGISRLGSRNLGANAVFECAICWPPNAERD